MGDRANVVIRDTWPDASPKEGVFLYTHWAGTELPEILRKALDNGRDRWDDSQYLARIVFREMIRGVEDESTGYGISTRLCDNEHPLLVLDCNAQTVTLLAESDYKNSGLAELDPDKAIPFGDYVEGEKSWETLGAR